MIANTLRPLLTTAFFILLSSVLSSGAIGSTNPKDLSLSAPLPCLDAIQNFFAGNPSGDKPKLYAASAAHDIDPPITVFAAKSPVESLTPQTAFSISQARAPPTS